MNSFFARLPLLLIIPCIVLATEPDPVGNFSVPVVTQISPLVSFGQLLIGKNVLLPQFSGSYTEGPNNYTNLIEPNIIYGILDQLSLTLFVPVTLKSKLGPASSSGINDLSLQLEGAYFSKQTKSYAVQGTLVAAVQFPTGSSTKNPHTGTGSFSYFAGTTLAYLSPNWYAFLSPGAHLTQSQNGTKFGNSYLYQWGFARYIKSLSPKNCIFNLMLEFDGTYSEKTEVRGVTNPNSGGNTLLITPSIWLSSKYWLLQWGIGFPAIQQLNGSQYKTNYSIAYNIGVAFKF